MVLLCIVSGVHNYGLVSDVLDAIALTCEHHC